MKKSRNIIVSLILVLLIVILVSKALQDSYLKLTNEKAISGKVDSDLIKNEQRNINTSTSLNKAKVKKVIVIDPGHANKANLDKEAIAPNSSEMKIKDGGGAQGIVTKTPEYIVNMQVALKLRNLLEERGYVVKMTKVDSYKSLGNIERAELANKENADLEIRIHADSNDDPDVKGASMLIPAPINENTKAIHNKSYNYGKVILDTLIKEVGMESKGLVERSDLTGFNWSKVPVVLVEMGFLSNVDEDKLLSDNAYQNGIAKALADGIDLALK